MQRYISEDPLGFGGDDVNLYAYVGNDPINATDPSGLWSVGVCVSGAFGYGVAGTAELCVVGTTSGDFGETVTTGGVGDAGFVAGVSGGFQFNNANKVKDLGGPFATGGGTIGGGEGVGGDVFVGRNCRSNIYGGEIRDTIGAYEVDGIPGAEFHGGGTYTWATSWFDQLANGMGSLAGFGTVWP